MAEDDKKTRSGGSFGGKRHDDVPKKPTASRSPSDAGKSRPAPKTGQRSSVTSRAQQAKQSSKRIPVHDARSSSAVSADRDEPPQKPPARIPVHSATTATVAATAAGEDPQARLEEIRRSFDLLLNRASFANVRQDMGSLDGTLAQLDSDLHQLRTQGYSFRSFLENKVAVLANKWATVQREVDDDIRREHAALQREADDTDKGLRRVTAGNFAIIDRVASDVTSLERKVDAAERRIRGRYNDVAQTIRQTREQLDEIRWAMERAAEAQFDFLRAERLVHACKGRLMDEAEKDGHAEGILFLTDERLIFEQREEKATKKFLFITTDKEMVQAVRFAEPVGYVQEMEAEDTRRFLSSKEMLNLAFDSRARLGHAAIELLDGAKNEAWSQLIRRVQTGEIDRERVEAALAEKEQVSEQVAAVPTVCTTCGATLPSDIVRGQTSLSCEYCGAIIRLG